MRYNRGDLADTMRVARSLVMKGGGQAAYVYALQGGYTIGWTPPPFRQQHYKITPVVTTYVDKLLA